MKFTTLGAAALAAGGVSPRPSGDDPPSRTAGGASSAGSIRRAAAARAGRGRPVRAGALLAAAALAAGMSACGSSGSSSGGGNSSAPAGSTLTVADVAPFSGVDAALGPTYLVSFNRTVQAINNAGGVLGHTLPCTPPDTRAAPPHPVPPVPTLLPT